MKETNQKDVDKKEFHYAKSKLIVLIGMGVSKNKLYQEKHFRSYSLFVIAEELEEQKQKPKSGKNSFIRNQKRIFREGLIKFSPFEKKDLIILPETYESDELLQLDRNKST